MRRLCAFLLVLVAMGGGVVAPVFVPNTAAPTHLGAFRQTAQQAGTASRLQSGVGVPFLADVLAGARLVVLIRFAGWTDVTTDLLHDPPTTITPGRPNESGLAPPARATLTLKNPGRRYSQYDPMSPNWPYVRENAILWIKLFVDGQYVTRFYGEIKGFKPRHDITGNLSLVDITAADITQRLGLNTAPLRSAMNRTITSSNPIAYWPVEDGTSATSAVSGLLGGAPLSVRGSVRFGATTGPDGSRPLADFSSGGSLAGPVPTSGASSTSWRVEFATKFNTLSTGNFAAVLDWFTSGSIALWEIAAATAAEGGLMLQYIAAGGGTVAYASNVAVDDGAWHHIRVTADQSGANINVVVYLDATAVITQTIASSTIGPVYSVSVNPTGDPTEEVPSLGHLAVWAPWAGSVDTVAAFRGHPGETPGARLTRVCGEEGIVFATVGTYSTSTRMGPQSTGSIMAVVRECELADGGLLYAGLSEGLQLQGISARYNQSSLVSFDAAAGEVLPPFEPVPDDYGRANRVTATRTNGGSRTAVDDDGPLGTRAVGTYDSSPPQSINYQTDTRLTSRAAWEVRKGSGRPGFRYPAVSLNLRKTPSKIPGWLTVTPGCSFTINPPYLEQNPAEDIRLVAEGWTEVLTPLRWEVTPNCSGQDVYDVFTVGHSRLGRVDARGSTLATDAGVGSTTLSVAKTTGGVWTTTATRPGDFPFDVEISGIQVTVTAIVGTSSPQTFTVTGVVKELRAGDTVKLWRPGVIAL